MLMKYCDVFQKRQKVFIEVKTYIIVQQKMNCMSAEEKKRGNWKRYAYLYNQNKNLEFKCLCGKKYLSFPALYLHCQKKHGKKLSSQLVKEECQVAHDQKSMAYIYTLDPENISDERQIDVNLKEINNVFVEFFQNHRQNMTKSQINKNSFAQKIEKTIIQQFFNFLKEEKTYQKQNFPIRNIPVKFNDFFITFRERSQGTQQWELICKSILFRLGQWLFQKSYTDLRTVFNQESNSLNHHRLP